MDRQKTQRIALGLAAALAVGAGGYGFIFRDALVTPTQMTDVQTGRRKAEDIAPVQHSVRPKPVETPEVRPAPKVRDVGETPAPVPGRRGAAHGGERTLKAHDTPPAA